MSESKQIDCFMFQKEETYEAAKKKKWSLTRSERNMM